MMEQKFKIAELDIAIKYINQGLELDKMSISMLQKANEHNITIPSEIIHSEHAFGYESAYVGDIVNSTWISAKSACMTGLKSHGLYPSVITH